MVLVDTSIWFTHLRQGSRQLEELLLDGEAVCHPFIIGELACGNMRNRNEILSLLQSLPMVPNIDLDEFLFFIEKNKLMGEGAGFVDVHLLASALVSETPLWTSDRRLNFLAVRLGIAYK